MNSLAAKSRRAAPLPDPEAGRRPDRPTSPLFALQRAAGNRATTALVQRSCACGGAAGSPCHCPDEVEEGLGGLPIQTKLAISAPGDPDEREADEVAEQVMRMPDPGVPRTVASTEREPPPSLGHLAGLGAGRPLDSVTRGYFESRFDEDLSGIRIHTGAAATRAARAIRARAFTIGSDVAFAPGEYRPDTRPGQRVLAHEITHTLQQRKMTRSAPARVLRTVYSACTNQQLTDYIKPAKVQAKADLDSVIGDLNARPLSDLTKGALWLAFRRQDDATAVSVKETLQEIRDGLDSGTIECEQPDGWQFMCEHGRLGYTVMFGTMHLCMNAWPSASAIQRADNLIHEGAHAFAWIVGDPGYFTRSCAETARTSRLLPATRLSTPDAYSCFVHYMRHDTGIEARAEEYRGASLVLRQHPTGSIDLNGADVRIPTFRMEGAPSESGFRYRWAIFDAANRSYLLRADSGSPFQFGNHPSAYIGAATRALLKERGIDNAELRCRVAIPGKDDRLFTLALQFTR